MQHLTISLQLQGIPLNVAIAFLLEVILESKHVGVEKLSKAGYSFSLEGEYINIMVKTFHDTGADEVMLSKRFCSCLNMDTVKSVQIRSILHDEPVKNLKKTHLYIPYEGKVMAYSMSSKISKNWPNCDTRKLL